MKPLSIIILLLLAIIPAHYADKKGRSALLFYFLGIVTTPIIATIIVACLDDKSGKTNKENQTERGPSKSISVMSVQHNSEESLPQTSSSTNSVKDDTVPNLDKSALNHQNVAQHRRLFCRKCGKELSPNSGFCRFCGTKIPQYLTSETGNQELYNEKTSETIAAAPSQKIDLPQTSINIAQFVSSPYVKKTYAQEGVSGSRFETLYEIEPNVIQDNTPVLIEKVSLIIDHQANTLFAHSIFRSLSDVSIIAMLIDVRCNDIWGEKTAPVEGFHFIDLKTKRGELFGQNVSIQIPDNSTRIIDVIIKRVLFADRTVVNACEARSSLEHQKSLDDFFGKEELKNEYIRETNPFAQYTMIQGKHYWRCACGSINRNEDQTCYRCKADKNLLFNRLNVDLISSNLFAIKEEKRIKEEKEKAEREARIRQEQEKMRKAREEQERITREREELIAKQRRQERARRKKIIRRLSIVSAVALGTAFLVYAIGWHIIPYTRYKKADQLLEQKSYDEAYAGFIALGDFSDSAKKAADSLYQKGKRLLDDGCYYEAATTFEQIPKYKDSAEKAVLCRNEAAYVEAKALLDKEDFKAAADAFSALGDYSDSSYWSSESTYQYAQGLLEDGKYLEAHSAFSSILDHKDSKVQVNECYYLLANKLLNEKKFEDARSYFSKLNYKDSNALAKECYYLLATEYLDKGQYEKARTYFIKIPSYKDSQDQANESYYLLGNQQYIKKKYHDAYKTFISIKTYKDSQDLANEAEYLYAIECFDSGKYEQAYHAFLNVRNYKDANDRLPEAKYQYALSLSSNSKWKEAYTLFKSLDRYKDSQSKYKDAYYQYGLQLLTEKSYKSAVTVFETLGNYQESRSKLNEARYGYVKAHRNNTDTTTYNYLTELKKTRYKDSETIYASLYAWKISNIYFNSDKNSTKKMTSISKYSALYSHFELAGGPPGGKTYIYMQATLPDGSLTNRSKTSDQWYRGSYGYWGWDNGIYYNPGSGKTGTMRLRFYDESNNLIGEATVKITN